MESLQYKMAQNEDKTLTPVWRGEDPKFEGWWLIKLILSLPGKQQVTLIGRSEAAAPGSRFGVS